MNVLIVSIEREPPSAAGDLATITYRPLNDDLRSLGEETVRVQFQHALRLREMDLSRPIDAAELFE